MHEDHSLSRYTTELIIEEIRSVDGLEAALEARDLLAMLAAIGIKEDEFIIDISEIIGNQSKLEDLSSETVSFISGAVYGALRKKLSS